MHRFPVVCWHHLDRVPGTAVEKSSVRSLAGALLTTNAEIGIDLNPAKRRMILVRHPEHAGFDGTVFDARRRAGASGAAVGRDGQDSRPFLTGCLAVAL